MSFLRNLFRRRMREIDITVCGLANAGKTTIVKYLETQRFFPKNYFSNYIGYADIYELKWIHNNIQYRPLGCFGPGDKEFTLLIGAKEKGDRLEPIRAPEIAVRRRKLIHQDRRYIDDFV